MGAALALLAGIVAGAVLAYIAPLRAEPGPLAAVRADPAVRLDTEGDTIQLLPAGEPPTTGLIFYPGARVEPEAYMRILSGITAADTAVFIPRMPLGFAVLASDAADDVRESHPEIERWLIGGHSLGGATACRHASRRPGVYEGLVLTGAFCADDVSGSGLRVVSLRGTEDRLTTAEKVTARRDNLPADAVLVEVEGASHASFGSYGSQRGDGSATADPDAVRDRVTTEVLALTEE